MRPKCLAVPRRELCAVNSLTVSSHSTLCSLSGRTGLHRHTSKANSDCTLVLCLSSTLTVVTAYIGYSLLVCVC